HGRLGPAVRLALRGHRLHRVVRGAAGEAHGRPGARPARRTPAPPRGPVRAGAPPCVDPGPAERRTPARGPAYRGPPTSPVPVGGSGALAEDLLQLGLVDDGDRLPL